MQERTGDLFEDKEISSNVNRYEEMKKIGASVYFDVEEYIDIVNFYVGHNKMKSAYEACLAGLQIHPAASELKLKIAQLMVTRGKAQEAINWLNKVKEIKDSSYEFYTTKGIARVLLGDSKRAMLSFERAIELCSFEDLEDLFYNIGESLENSADYAMALKFYSRAYHTFIDNPDFVFRAAFCFDKLGQFDKSIKYYQRFLDENPFSDNAWYNIGIIYNKIEDYHKAIEAYDFAIALDNGHYDALFNKANALANAEDYPYAIKIYKEYLEMYPGSFTAKYYIGECLYQQKEYDKSIIHFQDLIEEFPDFADGYYGLGLVLYEQDKHQEAVDKFNVAIGIDEEHVDAWYALGNAFTFLCNWDEACRAYKNALKLNKFDVDARVAYANACANNNNTEGALATITEAVDILPENSEIMFSLAGYMLMLGFKASGVTWFQKGWELFADDAEITFKIYPEAETMVDIMEIMKKTDLK